MEVVSLEREDDDIDGDLSSTEHMKIEQTPKRLKSGASTSSSSARGSAKKYEGIIGKLNDLQKSVKVEEACDHFGKYVADKLRTLSGTRRILAEQELQNVLTKYIIGEMSGSDVQLYVNYVDNVNK